MRLFEFVMRSDAGESRYFISCSSERAALKAAHRLASGCAVKVFWNGQLVGEADRTKWKWNLRSLVQSPQFKARI